MVEANMILRVSQAARWLKTEKGIEYTRAGLYRMISRKELPCIRRFIGGGGHTRSAGRIYLDTNDLERLFVRTDNETR